VEYGEQGLDLLEAGLAPEEAMERLLADDQGAALRQVGIIDMKGLSAAHTGEENSEWAGSRQGENYTVQGNILVGPEVVDAVADKFESTAGMDMSLAERLILALEAGQSVGGDKRWGRTQSAAIRIADPDDPGRGGDHISLAIDVGEHEAPVAEMKRIYRTTFRRLGYRSFSVVAGSDVVELKRKLQRLGYWRPDGDPIPQPPKYDVDRDLSRSDPELFQQRRREYSERSQAYREAYAGYDEEAVAAVDAFRRDQGMDYPGNPPGLVDDALVEAIGQALESQTP
jgi:uncharacterized Ntn-hydrolase superfamily protein